MTSFFSAPLDLDFSMLEAFTAVYQGLAPPPKGPRLPLPASQAFHEAAKQRMRQVLAADPSKAPASLGSTYTPTQQQLFAWYKYLFIDGSKPVTHMRALVNIDSTDLAANAPETLKQLVERARTLLPNHEDRT